MGKFRKIDPRIWNDAKFRGLSDDGRFVFLYVLTHPNMTMLGAMRASVEGLSAELGWKLPRFREAFREGLAKGLFRNDMEAAFLWVPNFIRYNPPESPNVVRAWGKCTDLLPECDMQSLMWQLLKGFVEGLGEGFAKALREVYPKPSPNQEQEQEQEQDKNPKEDSLPPKAAPSKPPPKPRARDPVWDAVVAVFFSDGVVESMRKRVGKLVAGFRELGATEDEIRKRRARIFTAWGVGSDTVDSVLKHWGEFTGDVQPVNANPARVGRPQGRSDGVPIERRPEKPDGGV